MNEKILHIANDLNDQHPLPDVPADTAWADMQKLLDDDDDNIIVPPPIPPHGNGYWKYGLLLLLIIVMAVYYISNIKTQQPPIAKQINSTRMKADKDLDNIKQPVSNSDVIKGYGSSDLADSLTTGKHEEKYDSSEKSIVSPKTLSKNSQVIKTNTKPGYRKNDTAAVNKKHHGIKSKKYNSDPNLRVIITESAVEENDETNTAKKTISRRKRKIDQKTSENDFNFITQNAPGSKTINEVVMPSSPLNQDSVANNDHSSIPIASILNPDSLNNQQLAGSKPGKIKPDTIAKINNEKKRKKITWTAGLGLTQSFAIGSQQYSGYNANGSRGIIADYIPVPFIRGYINKKLYLQLEAQFHAPQYTKQPMIKSEIIIDSNGNTETSTYINKLYYLNIPVSIHYSPYKNFAIGAGLQFSKLKNAVGRAELKQPGGPGTSLSTSYTSLKNDALYKEIKNSEWRILLETNYEWKNLIFCIRYSQALSNFVSVPVSATRLTQAKNSSLQLLVWYTLWKNKK